MPRKRSKKGERKAKLTITGEELTTLSVSVAVSNRIHRKKGKKTSVDNYLRELLGMPIRERHWGRPLGKKDSGPRKCRPTK